MIEPLTTIQHLLAVLSGGFVSFSLGLIGGGGSILAVPLLLYLVGYPAPHVVIGTTALAVSANAYLDLIPHARSGHVRWKSSVIFALAGALGAFAGSSLGKVVEGQKLLFLFSILMLVVAALMLRPRGVSSQKQEQLNRGAKGRLVLIGIGTGLLSGFFGIGGGFLIVPGLILATGMPMINAIGSSLFSVGTFGLTTAANYAFSGLVAWQIAIEYVLGGVIGGWAGEHLANRLGHKKATLNYIYSAFIAIVAIYMIYRNLRAIRV